MLVDLRFRVRITGCGDTGWVEKNKLRAITTTIIILINLGLSVVHLVLDFYESVSLILCPPYN